MSQKIYQSIVLDIHDVGPLSETPTFGSSKIIWMLDEQFEFHVPSEASSLRLALLLHAPFVEVTGGTEVEVILGDKEYSIFVKDPEPFTVELRRGDSLFFGVESCVVPADLDQTSPDDRNLCLGFSHIQIEPPSFKARYLELLW